MKVDGGGSIRTSAEIDINELAQATLKFKKRERCTFILVAVIFCFLAAVQIVLHVDKFLGKTSVSLAASFSVFQLSSVIPFLIMFSNFNTQMHQMFPAQYEPLRSKYKVYMIYYTVFQLWFAINLFFIMDGLEDIYTRSLYNGGISLYSVNERCSNLTLKVGLNSLNYLVTSIFQVQNIMIVLLVIYMKPVNYVFAEIDELRFLTERSDFVVYKDEHR